MGVEGLSPVQWHPFTSRAGPEPHTLLAHVKGYGPWTQVRLAARFAWFGTRALSHAHAGLFCPAGLSAQQFATMSIWHLRLT